MAIRPLILQEIEQIAAEQGKTMKPLDDDLVIADSGLDSLCLAILVARLEDKLGTDPFTASDQVLMPVTLGDLIDLYEHQAPVSR